MPRPGRRRSGLTRRVPGARRSMNGVVVNPSESSMPQAHQTKQHSSRLGTIVVDRKTEDLESAAAFGDQVCPAP